MVNGYLCNTLHSTYYAYKTRRNAITMTKNVDVVIEMPPLGVVDMSEDAIDMPPLGVRRHVGGCHGTRGGHVVGTRASLVGGVDPALDQRFFNATSLERTRWVKITQSCDRKDIMKFSWSIQRRNHYQIFLNDEGNEGSHIFWLEIFSVQIRSFTHRLLSCT